MSFSFNRKPFEPIAPLINDGEKKPQGVTLTEKEIIKGVQDGTIKIEDMTIKQRRKYRKFER